MPAGELQKALTDAKIDYTILEFADGERSKTFATIEHLAERMAARAKVPIRSLPVDVYYPPVTERRSHYRKVVDTLRIIRVVAPLLMRR